jgi:hypothetical protein
MLRYQWMCNTGASMNFINYRVVVTNFSEMHSWVK